MNGFSNILVWILGGLFGLSSGLISFIVHLHIKSDDERYRRLNEELGKLRDRMHEWAPHIGWVDVQRHFDGKERRK